MMSETFESKNGIQPAVSEAKTEAAAGDDVTVRYIEGLLASNRPAGPIGYKPDAHVRQYDTHLNSKYKSFNVFKQFAVMRLYHHWPKVVGAVLGKQTKVLEIKPPIIKVAAMTSPCLQQLQMMKRQLLKKINDFYGSELITELECTMYRQSYLKAIQPVDAVSVTSSMVKD